MCHSDDSMREKTVDSKRVYEGRIINLRVDTVELPSGRKAPREIVEHPGAVAIVPILPDGRFVLVRQYRAAVGEVLLEIPAGTLKKEEDPLECAHRELIEETNYRAGRMQKMMFNWIAPGYAMEGMHYYLAQDLVPHEGTQDDDENVEVFLLEFDKVIEFITEGNIKDAKSVAAIFLARHILQNEQ